MPVEAEAAELSLERHLSVALTRYSTCLDSLDSEETAGGLKATLRFQHLKFDSKTNEPKFSELAACLADHLVSYAFKSQRNPSHPSEYHRRHREARSLLRPYLRSGEAGEILAYFLVEALLQAPQMVAKLDLKTSHEVETLGADGIHMKWNEKEGILDVYFLESKLEKSVSHALSHAVRSISDFHAKRGHEHELRLVTSHYKHADDHTKDIILRILRDEVRGSECRLKHACLVGYDWNAYKQLPNDIARSLTLQFRAQYTKDRARLHKLIHSHFSSFSERQIEFDIFLLPFRSVQEFRSEFARLL